MSGKPTFKEGDKCVPMNDDVPAKHFDDGSTAKTIPGVEPALQTEAKPEPEFTGTAPSVTVVRDKNETKVCNIHTNSNTSYYICR